MRMWICRCGCRVHAKRARTALWKGAKQPLLGIVKPDLTVSINPDSRGVRGTRLTGTRVGIFTDPIICAWHGLRNVKFPDHPDPPFGPPDIAIGIDGGEVWRQAAGRVGAYLVFVQDTTTGVFADQRNGWVVFGKPDIIGGVHHDAVGIAIAGRGRDFLIVWVVGSSSPILFERCSVNQILPW